MATLRTANFYRRRFVMIAVQGVRLAQAAVVFLLLSSSFLIQVPLVSSCALCVHFNFSFHLPRSLPSPPCFFLHLLLAHVCQSLPNMCCTSQRIHTIMPLELLLNAKLQTEWIATTRRNQIFRYSHLKLHISTIFCATGTREEGSGL